MHYDYILNHSYGYISIAVLKHDFNSNSQDYISKNIYIYKYLLYI